MMHLLTAISLIVGICGGCALIGAARRVFIVWAWWGMFLSSGAGLVAWALIVAAEVTR